MEGDGLWPPYLLPHKKKTLLFFFVFRLLRDSKYGGHKQPVTHHLLRRRHRGGLIARGGEDCRVSMRPTSKDQNSAASQ